MPIAVIALIVGSACIHATWNLLAKRAGSNTAFTAVLVWVATIAYAPIAGIWWMATLPAVGLAEIGVIGVSAIFQVAYFVLLNRAYRAGDISLVYPVARGSGPLFTLVGAVLLLGERPSLLAIGGVALIGLGVLVLSSANAGLAARNHTTAIWLALAVGLSIASYSLWDKLAVSQRHIHPLLVNWGVNCCVALALTPYALRHADQLRAVWTRHRRAVVAVGLLNPLAYLIVLFALTIAPVSSIAPMREISIVLGTFLGARVLHEPVGPRRLIGAGVLTAGVVSLAFG